MPNLIYPQVDNSTQDSMAFANLRKLDIRRYINKIIKYYYPSTQIARFNTVKNFCFSSLLPRSFNVSMDFATSLEDQFHFKLSCQAEQTTGKNKNEVDDKDNSASRMQKISILEKEVHSIKHLNSKL